MRRSIKMLAEAGFEAVDASDYRRALDIFDDMKPGSLGRGYCDSRRQRFRVDAREGLERRASSLPRNPKSSCFDAKLSDFRGTEFCRKLREKGVGVCVLMISAAVIDPADRVASTATELGYRAPRATTAKEALDAIERSEPINSSSPMS
jgi:hypothetical protein